MADQMVKWEVRDGIGTITLNRPEKRNAINGEVLEGINKAFSELSLSLETRVILLQGAGPAFSAGIDFKYLAAAAQDDPFVGEPFQCSFLRPSHQGGAAQPTNDAQGLLRASALDA